MTGEDFYDRTELFEEVLTNLRDGDLRRFLVLGTRRIGKTSILKELQVRAMAGLAGDQFICLEWNMQGKKTPQETRDALLPRYQVRKLEREYPEIRWAELRKQDCLVELMEDICRSARERYGRRVLLTIDEPEPLELCAVRVQDGSATDEERSWLENVRDMICHVEALACVVAAPPTAMKLFKCEINPLDECVLLELKPLPREEALRLIYLEQHRSKHGLDRNAFGAFLGGDEGVALILAASGRIPYLLQSICRQLLVDGGTIEDPIQAIKKLCLAAVFEQTFSSYFKEFSPLQKLIMLTLARRGQLWSEIRLSDNEVGDHLLDVIPAETASFGLLLGELERLQVVVSKEKEDGIRCFRIAFSLFGEWMRTSFPDRWQEAIFEVRRRNELQLPSDLPVPQIAVPTDEQNEEFYEVLIAELTRTFETGSVSEELFFKKLEYYSAKKHKVGFRDERAEAHVH